MNDNSVSYPANDGDIDGIYQYLGWHMRKAGMSSHCFHFLEALKRHATKVDPMAEKWATLYNRVNEMMMQMGAEGEVGTQDDVADKVMGALADIDGGVYKPMMEG